MLMAMSKCPNCGKVTMPHFIEIDGEFTHMGIEVCSLCRKVNLPKDFVRELYKQLPLTPEDVRHKQVSVPEVKCKCYGVVHCSSDNYCQECGGSLKSEVKEAPIDCECIPHTKGYCNKCGGYLPENPMYKAYDGKPKPEVKEWCEDKMIILTCVYCNKKFQKLKAEYKQDLKKCKAGQYCSEECYHESTVKEDATYESIHRYVQNRKPKPDKCSWCSKKTDFLDLANISGKYTRNPEDYEYICRSCHMKDDGRLEELHRLKRTR